MRCGYFLLTALVCSWVLLACISPVSLDNRSCPCGEGYHCCETLALCLPVGQDCPPHFPPSSEQRCSLDEQCPAGESCHSWSNASSGQDETVFGPQQCRRQCTLDHQCTSGELCQLAPHDNQTIKSLQVAPLCVADTFGKQCGGWSCSENCSPERVGQTYCEGNTLHGCLVSTHPLCGLACQEVTLAECDRCTEEQGMVICKETGGFLGLCAKYACSACPANTSSCQDGVVRTCLSVPTTAPECDQLCLPVDLASCDKGCSSDDNAQIASCLP